MIFTIPKPPTHDWRIDHAGKHFRADCADHKLTIKRDDGLYRHLRFTSADSENLGCYWFDIHTAPGILTFHGDAGTWVFARTADMLTFFRGHRVNPGYWAEKVIANDRHGTAQGYDHLELLGYARTHVLEYAAYTWEKPDPADWDFAGEEEADWSASRAAFYREFIDLIRWGSEFEYDGDSETAARESLSDWTYAETITEPVPYSILNGSTRTKVATKAHRPFQDLWDCSFNAPDHLYLYACHAIVWGIEQYDAATAERG